MELACAGADTKNGGGLLVKEELQERLFKKYPKIFRQKDLPMTETAMCWGIDCGDGWFWLIDKLCEYLQFQTDENGWPQVEAVQVKEKFGGLRFYIGSGSSEIFEVISFAESLSESICEDCGSIRDVGQTEGGWVWTLCAECAAAKKREKIAEA